jgi:hypothetical protein
MRRALLFTVAVLVAAGLLAALVMVEGWDLHGWQATTLMVVLGVLLAFMFPIEGGL